MTPPAGSGAATSIMRLRVALLGVKPTTWRRIEVAVSATLGELHTVIQAAMGWQDLHLHSFRVLGRQYDPGHGAIDEVRLADLRLRAGERFSYVYDHSAPWEHELRVEAIGPARLAGSTRAVLPDRTPARRNGAQDPKLTTRSRLSYSACPIPMICSSWPSSVVPSLRHAVGQPAMHSMP